MLKTTLAPSAAQSVIAEETQLNQHLISMVCWLIIDAVKLCMIFAGLVITGNETLLQINSSANLNCSSDLDVLNIQWLNGMDNRQELLNSTGKKQLILPIEMVTSSLIDIIYTCKVQVMLATGISGLQMNVTLKISSEFYWLILSLWGTYLS
jgi:hypothetical protein